MMEPQSILRCFSLQQRQTSGPGVHQNTIGVLPAPKTNRHQICDLANFYTYRFWGFCIFNRNWVFDVCSIFCFTCLDLVIVFCTFCCCFVNMFVASFPSCSRWGSVWQPRRDFGGTPLWPLGRCFFKRRLSEETTRLLVCCVVQSELILNWSSLVSNMAVGQNPGTLLK